MTKWKWFSWLWQREFQIFFSYSVFLHWIYKELYNFWGQCLTVQNKYLCSKIFYCRYSFFLLHDSILVFFKQVVYFSIFISLGDHWCFFLFFQRWQTLLVKAIRMPLQAFKFNSWLLWYSRMTFGISWLFLMWPNWEWILV